MGLLSAAVGLGGALLGRSWAKSDASDMRHWQEGMRSSAHQAEVADLEAAGLNKVLTIGGQGGAAPMTGMPRQTDIAAQMANAATARKLNAEAEVTEVDAWLKGKVKDAIKKNPQLEEAVTGANIARNSGIPPWLGGAANLLKQGWQWLNETPAPKRKGIPNLYPEKNDGIPHIKDYFKNEGK